MTYGEINWRGCGGYDKWTGGRTGVQGVIALKPIVDKSQPSSG